MPATLLLPSLRLSSSSSSSARLVSAHCCACSSCLRHWAPSRAAQTTWPTGPTLGSRTARLAASNECQHWIVYARRCSLLYVDQYAAGGHRRGCAWKLPLASANGTKATVHALRGASALPGSSSPCSGCVEQPRNGQCRQSADERKAVARDHTTKRPYKRSRSGRANFTSRSFPRNARPPSSPHRNGPRFATPPPDTRASAALSIGAALPASART